MDGRPNPTHSQRRRCSIGAPDRYVAAYSEPPPRRLFISPQSRRPPLDTSAQRSRFSSSRDHRIWISRSSYPATTASGAHTPNRFRVQPLARSACSASARQGQSKIVFHSVTTRCALSISIARASAYPSARRNVYASVADRLIPWCNARTRDCPCSDASQPEL